MKPRARSVLLLSITLVIGMVLGALIQTRFFDGRMKRMHNMRTEEGFVASYIDTIQPASAEQEAAVRGIVAAAAKDVTALVQGNRETIHQRMEAMRAQLYPLLDDDQRQRVEQRARRPRSPGEKKK